MFYFPCSPVHKICLLFTDLNNEDRHIFRDSELRKQSANFKQTQRKQIIYFHVNRYIIFRDSTYYQNFGLGGTLYIFHEKLPKDGKVLCQSGFMSKVLPGPLTDLSPVHKICLLFTDFNNEDKHIFRDSELRKQSANFTYPEIMGSLLICISKMAVSSSQKCSQRFLKETFCSGVRTFFWDEIFDIIPVETSTANFS
jgi:hypothetical protein